MLKIIIYVYFIIKHMIYYKITDTILEIICKTSVEVGQKLL